MDKPSPAFTHTVTARHTLEAGKMMGKDNFGRTLIAYGELAPIVADIRAFDDEELGSAGAWTYSLARQRASDNSIDWEFFTPLLFRVSFRRIRTIAVEFSGGEFWMRDEFDSLERGFRTKLFTGMLERI
ncbi:hypothetical protein CHU98_g4713 [Xylaria longipes]|nr:hypothetical protein CHU98_g4713 [Xylaria longipes]